MRVLHITDRLSARGGADWHLLGVLAELAAGKGAELLLAAGKGDGSAAAPCPLELCPALAAPRRVAAAAALDAIAARFRPDAIHVHNVVNPDALEWAAARGAIMTVQDHRSFCPGRGKLTAAGEACREPMSRALCAGCFQESPGYFEEILAVTGERLAAVRRMRRVTVLSRYMAGELVAAGVPAARIAVIPPFVCGLDPDQPPAGPPCVLFAGRLVTAKGTADAAEAWRRARLDLPLVFAGTGPERSRLEAAGFEVLGWVPHARMASVYRRARALVLPSRWQEPLGIAGLEALALGVPVAAWDSGGVRDWHPDPVPWGDVSALAARLRDLVLAPPAPPAAPPPGFERAELMDRLRALYAA